jgi:hypothetical protein
MNITYNTVYANFNKNRYSSVSGPEPVQKWWMTFISHNAFYIYTAASALKIQQRSAITVAVAGGQKKC